jgi:hypothetical protein
LPDLTSSSSPRRRTILQGAAWSVPVLAAAVAAPTASASGNSSLVFTQGFGSFTACGVVPGGVLLLTSGGSPVANATVNVTLPAELQWGDLTTGVKAFTTDAFGRVDLGGWILGTGTAGTFAVTATSSSGATASANATATASSGVIWYSSDQATATNSDPAGTVADARDIVVTTNYVYTITTTGEWYVKSGANSVSPYTRISGAPSIDSVWGGLGSDYGYALAGGSVYKTAATTTATPVTGVSGVTSLATTGGRVFASTSGGDVYRATDGASSFTQVTLATATTTPLIGVTAIAGNQGGGYGWAISGTDIYYILDNNRAYLSTTVAAAKPANPVALAIGATWAYALDADGTVWAHFTASAGAWQQLSGLPGAATEIAAFLGGDTLWALSGSTPFWSSNASTFNSSNPGAIAGTAAQLWVGASNAYVRTTSGQWWHRTGAATTGVWNQITGTPGNTVTKIATNYGNFAWALANKNEICTTA